MGGDHTRMVYASPAPARAITAAALAAPAAKYTKEYFTRQRRGHVIAHPRLLRRPCRARARHGAQTYPRIQSRDSTATSATSPLTTSNVDAVRPQRLEHGGAAWVAHEVLFDLCHLAPVLRALELLQRDEESCLAARV